MSYPTLFDKLNPEPCRDTRYTPGPTRHTSQAARASLTPATLSRQQQTILDAIARQGAHGLTDEEGIALTGLNSSSYRPRRGELWTLKRIHPGGHRATQSGRQAVVWTT